MTGSDTSDPLLEAKVHMINLFNFNALPILLSLEYYYDMAK
jgi:hypothetical protein